MAYGQPFTYSDYSGGNNPAAGPYLLEDSQCKKSRNVHTTPTGSFRKREGFTDLITDTGLSSRFDSLHSAFAVNLAAGNSILVSGKQASASNDRIAKIVGTTVTTLKSTLTQGKRWEWVQAPASGGQGPIYGVNGTDTPQQWDGSAASTSDWTAATGTVPAQGRYPTFHTDRIWMPDLAHKGRVAYSGLTSSAIPGPDPRNWDTDDYVDLEPDDGLDLTGTGSIGPYVLVTKARKTYAITDPATAANRKISDEIGCIAHRSIVETAAGTLFLSEDLGVCVTDGNSVTPLSDNILPLIRTAANSNPTLLPFAAACYFDHSYWLSIPYSQTYNDLLVEYDLRTKSWWLHDGPVNQWTLSDPGGTPKLYVANSNTTTVRRAFTPSVYQDGGANYASKSYFESPYYVPLQYYGHHVFKNPHVNQRFNQFRVDGRGAWTLSAAGAFTDSYTLVEGSGWETTDSGGTWGTDDQGSNFGSNGTSLFAPVPGTTEFRYPTPLSGVYRALSLRYENDDANDWEIQATTLFVTPRTD